MNDFMRLGYLANAFQVVSLIAQLITFDIIFMFTNLSFGLLAVASYFGDKNNNDKNKTNRRSCNNRMLYM